MGLTNYQIKLLAAVLMVVDHVGYVFFPQEPLFRMIGRLSFPLFVWLLVQGEHHTRNIWRYGVRLLIGGIISQPLYWLVFNQQDNRPDINILFTLLVGVACLRGAKLAPELSFPIWMTGGAIAEFAHFNYGMYGIAITWIISLLNAQPQPKPQPQPRPPFMPSIGWWALWSLPHLILLAADFNFGVFQLPAIASPMIFQMANHQQGAKAKWFYSFYPLHLLVLLLIRLLLQGDAQLPLL
jgi:hypothetical protein